MIPDEPDFLPQPPELEPLPLIGDNTYSAPTHHPHPTAPPSPTPLIEEKESAVVSELRQIWRTVLSCPLVVLLGSFCILCAWSLTSLTCFHVVIVTAAQTTNERVRRVYGRGGDGEAGAVNTADRGCVHNWAGAMCGCRPLSKLPQDFSAMVIAPASAVGMEDGNVHKWEGGGGTLT